MFVLSEQELARMKDQQLREYVPEIRNLTLLQSEVEELLNSNSGLTPDERLGLINRAQIRVENLKKQTASPLTTSKQVVAKAEDAVSLEENEEPAEEHPDEEVIKAVHQKDREKAIHIMNYINDFPEEIKYNPANSHVSINGKVLKTSNIKQLINYLIKDTPKSHAPMGARSFMATLKTIRFPNELIFNSYLNGKKQDVLNKSTSSNADLKAAEDQTGFGISRRKRKAIIRFGTSKKPRISIKKKKINALRIY